MKQIDKDGQFTYCRVRAVAFGKAKLIIKTTLVRDTRDIVTSAETMTPPQYF